jgi:S1-C subfamily serine protease
VGTGSGVIISEDGYIVTNNHVIKEKLKLHWIIKKSYKAKLIGTDSKMDIALLKMMPMTNYRTPHLPNSDLVRRMGSSCW